MTLDTVAAHELPEVAAVLARAFRDNPALTGLLACDGPESRERILPKLLLPFCEVTQRFGTVEVVRDGTTIRAVSLAFGPDPHLPMAGELSMAMAVLRCRPQAALRFARFDRVTQRERPRSPHWYLWFLGVEPALQGRGLGSRLLHSLSRRANRETPLACHLETDRESNLRIYQRHGYVVTSSERVAGADTQMWFMTRPAEPALSLGLREA